MVAFSPERGVPPLLNVALKVTDWLTTGVAVDAVRVSAVAVRFGFQYEVKTSWAGLYCGV